MLISFKIFNFTLYIEKFFKEINSKSFLFSFEGIITTFWVIATPVFVGWTVLSLMETGLWCFLIINLTILTSRFIFGQNHKYFKLFLFSLLICLLILTRPESMLLGIVYIGVLLTCLIIKNGKIKKTFLQISIPLAVYIMTLTGLIIFRINYFGYPFPNTYYAKTSPDIIYNLTNGIIYFIKFFLSNPFGAISTLGVLIFLSSMILKVIRNKGRESLRNIPVISLQYGIPIIILFFGLIIPVLWGGNVFVDFRFYQPFWMLMVIPIFYLIHLLMKYFEFKINLTKYSFLFLLFIFISFYSSSQF
jgi:arabinofuranosyltransferase